MPERFPVTIRDSGGGFIEVDVAPSGRVWICTSVTGFMPDAAQREEFSKAYIAACWAAEGKVTPA